MVDFVFQHGKDFEAIQNNIALKYKKKGKPASMVKNKEQVRHFYYRTWHKITKYIDFDNGECVQAQSLGGHWGLASARGAWFPANTCRACFLVLPSPSHWTGLGCASLCLAGHTPSACESGSVARERLSVL